MKRVISRLLTQFGLGLGIIAIIFLFQAIKNDSAALEEKTIVTNTESNPADFPNLVDGKTYQIIVKDAIAHNLAQSSMGEIVQTVATQFLGAEYKAGLLEEASQEKLIISLQQFDCFLFVETVLAIAHNISQKNYGYQALSQQLENQRYWNGDINGYCSRLHYFSDWIKDNQRRGNVQNITRQLGGINTVKKLNFMTTHRQSYPQLASNEANFQCIASMEASLSTTFNYIPTQDISKIYPQLQPGD
ncbi:MAG: N-acetylmuramoyl-L-alanine amidase-like domain-containing protein, partial [Waterburya sp.]